MIHPEIPRVSKDQSSKNDQTSSFNQRLQQCTNVRMKQLVQHPNSPISEVRFEVLSKNNSEKFEPLMKITKSLSRLTNMTLTDQSPPLSVSVFDISSNAADTNSSKTHREVSKMNKNCDLSFLCAGRPTLWVNLSEGSDHFSIGHIEQLFSLWGHTFHVNGTRGETKFIIKASGCQFGLFCTSLSQPSCQMVDFVIEDPQGNRLSLIKRDFSSKVADEFEVDFNEHFDYIDRMLILGATILIDHLVFNKQLRMTGKRAIPNHM